MGGRGRVGLREKWLYFSYTFPSYALDTVSLDSYNRHHQHGLYCAFSNQHVPVQELSNRIVQVLSSKGGVT